MAKKNNNIDTGTDPTKKPESSGQSVTGNNVSRNSSNFETPGNNNDTRSQSTSNKTGRLLSEETIRSLEGLADSTPVTDNTPIAGNTTPAKEQAAATAKAQAIIAADNAEAIAEKNAESDSAFYIGAAPHYFAEQEYQVYYHDVVVYVQGTDLSEWLEGTVSIKYNTNMDANTCDFTLNNAANRFVLTPENLTGVWRRAGNSVNNDYDESAKENIFRFKSDPRFNAPDPVSNGLIWPLSHWGLIFHKYDPIRVWIRNPVARDVQGELADEWLPVFTGYITSFPKRDNHLTAGSTLQIHAEDIRTIIKNMRVNSNTYIYATPGAENENPSTTQSTGTSKPNKLRFGKNENVQFDKTFFKDLLLQGGTTNDPWVDLTFSEIVEALTFSEDAQVVIDGAKNRRSRDIEDAIKNKQKALILETDDATIHSINTDIEALFQEKNLYYNQPVAGGSTDTPLTGATSTTSSASTTGETTRAQNSSTSSRSRLGRMQRGFFRGSDASKVVYPGANDREDQIDFMETWYSLCAFGSPVRNSEDFLQFDLGKLRYWTLAEVKFAGERTVTTMSWAPDAQAVHMIEPGTSTTALPIFQEVKVINSDNAVASSRGFTNRLELLNKACDLVDYRFWVTGSGDIVFEFPQYDFSPNDYGRWGEVLTFDSHVLEEDLNEEATEIPTVMVGTRSLTGNQNTNQADGTYENFTGDLKVVVWVPALAARLGINKTDVVFPRVVSNDRLLQLTYMAFQKKLGTFTQYSMTTSYRPWILPNKPVFNKYRSRYALTESVSFNLPVTAGDRAGHSPPTSNLTLNYIRSIDVLGTPRYITGGPSMPIFYGEKQSNTLVSSLNKAVGTLDTFLEQIKANSNILTSQGLKEIRDVYGSFIPTGQDVYNVINMPVLENQAAAIAPNQTEELNRAAVTVRTALDDLQKNVDNKRTKAEIDKAIIETQQALKELSAQFAKINVSYSPIVGPDGALPDAGNSGFRHDTYEEPRNRPLADVQAVALENNCDLDQYQFSSPLGKAPSDLRLGGQLLQSAGTFPRVIVTNYGQKSPVFPGLAIFSGVDFLAKPEENVYAAANGTVLSVSNTEGFGSVIVIAHDNGYITSYSPVKASVSVGADITRNEIIGTVQTSKRSTLMGISALHLQTGTGGTTSGIVGYLIGEVKTYVITETDVQWLIRAVIGESSNPSDHDIVASCMLTRFAFKNDESLARRGTQLWSSFTEMLVGTPPYGRGYSQPVSYYWRTAEPPPDGKPVVNGNRKSTSIERRRKIRSLGTPEGAPFPSSVETIIREICSGRRPLINGNGVIDFRANDAAVPRFLARNAKFGAQIEHIPGARNVFISFDESRKWKARGNPKVQSFAPTDYKLTFYPPTNSGLGSYPGIPHKVYSVNENSKISADAWKYNKILIVGSIASNDFGRSLEKQLTQRKAKVDIYPQVGGLPGNTGSTKDLTYEPTMKEFKDGLASFKPDVVFVVYNAANLTNQQLQAGMYEIKEAVVSAGSDIWWVGPPVYDQSTGLVGYRPIFDQEGATVFGDRYIVSDPYTDPTLNRSFDLVMVVGPGAEIWASGIIKSSHGRNKGDPNGKLASQVSGGGWDGAIAPEDCPPLKQSKF